MYFLPSIYQSFAFSDHLLILKSILICYLQSINLQIYEMNNQNNQNHDQPEKKEQNIEKNMLEEQSKRVAEMLMQEEQQKMIREQIEAESPIVGQLFSLGMLMDEFVNNHGFYIKIQSLMNTYDDYRKIRRDGSCFYRALVFSIFEKIVCKGDNKLKEHFLDKIKKSKDHLLKANFQLVVFEELIDLYIQKLGFKIPKNLEDLLKLFRDPNESNLLVLLLRFITSAELKNQDFLYETFLGQEMPMEYFCQLEVQPIDKQADQIQIMALLNYLGVGVRIVQLDGSSNKEPYKVILPQSFKQHEIVGEFLYRPGHYDILYK